MQPARRVSVLCAGWSVCGRAGGNGSSTGSGGGRGEETARRFLIYPPRGMSTPRPAVTISPPP